MLNDVIHNIQSNDLAAIHKIDEVTNSHPWSLESLNSSLHHQKGYVYLHQQQITSFLIFADCVDYAEILLLATAPDFQKQSFASQLLLNLVKHAKESQMVNILLEVRQSNVTAQKFYQKHGFNYIHTRKNYYQKPQEDALIMERKC